MNKSPAQCLLFPVLLLFAGLVSAVEPAPAVGSAPQPGWSLTYNVHGGFAGLRQELSLNHLGELKVTNLKDYKIISRLLPERRVKEMTALLDSLSKLKASPPTQSLCRDCIRHDVNFRFAGEDYTYQYQTGDDLANELDAVLSYLGEYLQKDNSPM